MHGATLRSKSYLFLLLVLGLGILSGVLYSYKKYNFGLDVKGGIRLTYRMELTPEQRQQAEMYRSRLIGVLQNRAGGTLGVAEPIIAGKGDDQIIVELPGATNVEQAREVIGTSAKIQFYHAKNVATAKATYRPYSDKDQEKSDNPSVTFQRTTGAGGEIKFGDPEYQKIIDGWDLILEGTDLARADMKPAGEGYQPEMFFSREGAEKMEAWSRRFFNQGEKLAAVLDGRVLSISPVQEGAVLSDNAYINGDFPTEYVRNLRDLLNGGALPVEMTELSSEKIDPTIGNYALDRMVVAGLVAFAVTALFLIGYYAFPGFVALIALGLYVLFTLTVLKLMNATFSLAAIAGFILSVGMAVDANVLVYERLKEELKGGKSLKTAIELGFKRAFPAILDSNACTILTSLVLLAVGTGPVKGFATTLIIGVIISLFTAITITRSLLTFFVGSGLADKPSWYAPNRSWFGEKLEERANETPFNIVGRTKTWFIISLLTMVVAVPFFFMGGFKLNVEFRGGYEAVYPAAASVTSASVTQSLERAGYEGANVKMGEAAGERRVYITLPPNEKLQADLNSAPAVIAEAAGLGTVDQEKVSFTQIGPAIQQETVKNAIIAIVVSSLLIVVYLAFRFGTGFGGFAAGLRFGGSAILALVHDVIVVVGAAAIVGFLLKWEISGLFLTAMLTVIGFSVHDTIVIFDRIRENLHRQRQSETFGHLIDRSVTQTFARSINTSMTVIATLIIMIAMGTPTPDLKFFMLAMLIGILSGTYSSIFNASPILYLWDRWAVKNKGEEHSLVGMATKDMARQRVLGTEAATPQVASPDGARSYGQVKRRASSQQKGHIEIDD